MEKPVGPSAANWNSWKTIPGVKVRICRVQVRVSVKELIGEVE